MGERDIRTIAGRIGQRHGNNPRVLIYSHDTYGLGRLRRCMLVAGRLAADSEEPSVLVATGSPRAQAFHLPPGCDTVKLPSVAKQGKGQYEPRTLNTSLAEVMALRAELLKSAGRSFGPDLILVDHSHVGMHGELQSLFDDLDRWPRRPAVVLGLRDVIDDAATVRREWDAAGVWDILESVYDRIVVYGDPALPTTAQELELATRFPDKVRVVGYLGRLIRPAVPNGDGRPTIVVTAGGGGDGHALLAAYATFLERLPGPAPFRSVVVTGPFLSHRKRDAITARYRTLSHPIEVTAFTDRFDELLASAAGVVSMAGYNTVVEILSARVPALLVPRRTPTMEQWIRARRLADLDGDDFRVMDAPDPPGIASFVHRALERGSVGGPRVRLDGLARTVAELQRLIGDTAGNQPMSVEGRHAAALA
jgi:predicted glycosyltransferase